MKRQILDRSVPPPARDLFRLPTSGRSFGYAGLIPTLNFLENGMPFYHLVTGRHELFRVEIVFNAGHFYQEKNLVAMFTNRMLREGSHTRTMAEIATFIDQYGADLVCNTDRDRASLILYCLEKHLKYLIPLLEDLIRNPSFPESEFSLLKERRKQEYLVSLEKVSYLASRRFNAMLFGKRHPYGRPTESNDYDHVHLSDLKDFHHLHYHPANGYILVTGKHSNTIRPLIENHFGTTDWKASTAFPAVNYKIRPEKEKRQHLVKEGAVQTALRAGTTVPGPLHNDYIGLKVVNTLLGGYFGSRLMKNIREEKGYTYGISSSLVPMEKACAWVISTEVRNDAAEASIHEIRKEIMRLGSEKVSGSELDLVKNYMLGNFLRSIDGPFEKAEKLKEWINFQLPAVYFAEYIDQLKSIQCKDIMRLSSEYLDPSALFELSVGGSDKN